MADNATTAPIAHRHDHIISFAAACARERRPRQTPQKLLLLNQDVGQFNPQCTYRPYYMYQALRIR